MQEREGGIGNGCFTYAAAISDCRRALPLTACQGTRI